MEQPRRGHLARQVTPAYNRNNAQLYVGDCAEVMAALPAESVDAIVTSPPYAMQRKTTYGGIPEKEYPAWTVAWMEQARRILKPDGSVIINISPHIKNGNLSDYVLRTRLALRDDGWLEPDELVWHKTDAMPTGARNKPRRAWEHLLWLAKDKGHYSDALAGGSAPVRKYARTVTNAASRNGWAHGSSGPLLDNPVVRVSNVLVAGKAKRTGYDHPAPFPAAVAEWCGKLICPPGGTILDPFNGSASTGVAALRNGWNYIGIDAVPEYIDMSARRLEHEAGKGAA